MLTREHLDIDIKYDSAPFDSERQMEAKAGFKPSTDAMPETIYRKTSPTANFTYIF